MTDQGEPRRPAGDPIGAGVEAVAAGYRTLEYVIDAFAESVRRRPEARSAREAGAFRQEGEEAGLRSRARTEGPGRGSQPKGGGREGVSGAVPADLADLTAELFDRFGEAMHALAGAIGERASFERAPACPTIEVRGEPGASLDVRFQFTNTGPSALTEVEFQLTELAGATDRIDAARVRPRSPEDERIPRIRPGGSTVATFALKIPDDAPPGIYRGLITARPAPRGGRLAAEPGPDAWALLELEVLPPRHAEAS